MLINVVKNLTLKVDLIALAEVGGLNLPRG